ncbi:MAG: DNA polymerase III subunit delta [Candidatus Brocadiia bacterium]
MARVPALDIERHLESEGLGPLYVLLGEDEPQRAHATAALLEAAVSDDQPGSTVRRFEDVPEPSAVFDELRTLPFMGMDGRRVVVVEDGRGFLTDFPGALARYAEAPARTGTLLLWFGVLKPRRRRRPDDERDREQEPDAAKEAVKALKANAVIVQCGRLKWGRAKAWLRDRAREQGWNITPRAVDALVEAIGPNVAALETELAKLAAYVHPDTTITREAIRQAGIGGREQSVYKLGSAISTGDAREAIALCEQLLLRGEPLEMIVAVLASQVRRLWQVARLVRDGASQKDVRKALGVQSWLARQLTGEARGLSDAWFAAQLELLSEADVELKTTSVRSSEQSVWLESLVARLLEVERRAAC